MGLAGHAHMGQLTLATAGQSQTGKFFLPPPPPPSLSVRLSPEALYNSRDAIFIYGLANLPEQYAVHFVYSRHT